MKEDAPKAILCRECGCEIDDHGYDSDLARFVCCAGNCRCRERPSDIARDLLDAEPTEAEVEAVVSALSAAGHKWWGCSPVGSIELTVRAALKAAREARA